ncbi:MAG: ubiquitin-conjugating enzyme E2 [Methanomassiliicoccus sp.]|nr:ubiquitin-conjugating enzyme E2 [Methanomassiliicoccus sp.]
MTLPSEILIARLRNELKACSGYIRSAPDLSGPDGLEFPLSIDIELNQVPAHYLDGRRCGVRYTHRFRLVIDEEYPFKKPMVTWLTPIFHPNIMMPEDGGHMCTRLLEDWSFNSTIISFIKGVETLVTTPNPSNPFGTDSCTAAAEYYNKGARCLPPMVNVPPPRVVRSR